MPRDWVALALVATLGPCPLSACHDGHVVGPLGDRCDATACRDAGAFEEADADDVQDAAGALPGRVMDAGAISPVMDGGRAADGGARPDAAAMVGDGAVTAPSARPRLRFVAPRVLYPGDTRVVRLFGSDLPVSEGHQLYVDGQALGAWPVSSEREARTQLPPLSEGEHFLQIDEPSSPVNRGARLLVMARPEVPEVEIALPGSADVVLFDPERNAFFGLFSIPLERDVRTRLARVQLVGTTWTVTEADLPAPRSLVLSPDGRELLALNKGCILVHVDPDSMKLLGRPEELMTNCALGDGSMDGLADGRIVYQNGSLAPTVWDYPSWQSLKAPLSYGTVEATSPYQTSLMVGLGGFAGLAPALCTHDAGKEDLDCFTTLGTLAYSNLVAVSGERERIVHAAEVYDASGAFLGSLKDSSDGLWSVGVSWNGKVAATYDLTRKTLQAYDVSAATGPFAPIGAPIPIAESAGAIHRLFLDERGETAFGFTIRVLNANTSEVDYQFVVRRLGASAR